MKIHVFTTIDESWDSGDLNSSHKKYFSTKELRDDYFKNVLRLNYSENEYLEEYEPNGFHTKPGWAYSISKDEEDLEIVESKIW